MREIPMSLKQLSSLLVLSLVALSGTALAETATDQVSVSGAYVRAVPPGQPNSAAFMEISNGSSVDHALVGGSSPAAEVVELHTHTMEGGMMRMRQIEKIDLPAGQSVKLQPGGLHVMLIGLKQNLVPEENVPITLKYDDGSQATLEVPVRKLQMQMKMKMQDGDKGHMAH
jgi:periplasmic copper chaperone A